VRAGKLRGATRYELSEKSDRRPIFPNGAGTAVDPDSLLRRVILPALEVCEVCSKPESEHGRITHQYERNKEVPEWRGWHAFRRGLATNPNLLGVDDSVIQRILRHSNVAITQACYIKTASEDAKAAMQTLESVLNDTYVTPGPVQWCDHDLNDRVKLRPFNGQS
jgi:integrase